MISLCVGVEAITLDSLAEKRVHGTGGDFQPLTEVLNGLPSII